MVLIGHGVNDMTCIPQMQLFDDDFVSINSQIDYLTPPLSN